MELDDTLNKRSEINARIRKELDEPTDEWGVRVESVEVREVNPSKTSSRRWSSRPPRNGTAVR